MFTITGAAAQATMYFYLRLMSYSEQTRSADFYSRRYNGAAIRSLMKPTGTRGELNDR